MLLKFIVSILVLLDVCKERQTNSFSEYILAGFQSLFYWMYVKNIIKLKFIFVIANVSILVLLDVCKERINKNQSHGLQL